MTQRTSLLVLSLLVLIAAAGHAQSQAQGGRDFGRGRSDGDGRRGTEQAPTNALPTPFPTVPSVPNFPNRLGSNVAGHLPSAPGVLPGMRGLAGTQPLPLTPQPAPARPNDDPRMRTFGGYRDINNPGGATGPFPGWASSEGPGIVPWDPDNGRDLGRKGSGRDGRHWPPHNYAPPTYYVLPYYIPYVVNTQGNDPTRDPNAPPAPYPNQPTTQPGIAAQPLYPTTPMPAPGPYGSVSSSSGASSTGSATSTANLTLLVFKDRTIVMAKSYWLEGETVWYETENGLRTPISIAQLDLTLTQQLNKDRGIKFVLESR